MGDTYASREPIRPNGGVLKHLTRRDEVGGRAEAEGLKDGLMKRWGTHQK